MTRFLIMLLVLVISSPFAKSDVEYPEIGPIIPELLPEMPWFWPIVLPEEEPTTPVPEIPTAEEIYQANLARVLQIGAEIEEIESEISLLQFLLNLDPNGVNAPTLQMQIMTLQMTKGMLEAERQSLRDEMLESP